MREAGPAGSPPAPPAARPRNASILNRNGPDGACIPYREFYNKRHWSLTGTQWIGPGLASESSEDWMKGNSVEPGGPLKSKPAWSDTCAYSTTSAFLFGVARSSRRHPEQGP